MLGENQNLHSFYLYTRNQFILVKCSSYKQPMFVKKQLHSFGKLYLIYEDVPEKFLDEANVNFFIALFVTFFNLITG